MVIKFKMLNSNPGFLSLGGVSRGVESQLASLGLRVYGLGLGFSGYRGLKDWSVEFRVEISVGTGRFGFPASGVRV